MRFLCNCVRVCKCRGSGGISRRMRAQRRDATKQELVALNEFSFCLRPFDYLGGSRGWDFTHVSNPNHCIELHINKWRGQVGTCHGTHLKQVNDGYISLAGLPYQLKGQYGFHQEVDNASDTGGKGGFLRTGTHTQNKIGLSSQQNKWCCWSWYSHWKKEGVDFFLKHKALDKGHKWLKKGRHKGLNAPLADGKVERTVKVTKLCLHFTLHRTDVPPKHLKNYQINWHWRSCAAIPDLSFYR